MKRRGLSKIMFAIFGLVIFMFFFVLIYRVFLGTTDFVCASVIMKNEADNLAKAMDNAAIYGAQPDIDVSIKDCVKTVSIGSFGNQSGDATIGECSNRAEAGKEPAGFIAMRLCKQYAASCTPLKENAVLVKGIEPAKLERQHDYALGFSYSYPKNNVTVAIKSDEYTGFSGVAAIGGFADWVMGKGC